VAAEQVARVPRVGVLAPISISPEQSGGGVNDFREGMRSLGWIEGSNVSIEARFANGDPALLSANAADLVAERVDVIVAFSGDCARAARQATSTIPIVMDTGDPIRAGLVASLARPGGNVTGLSFMASDVATKQLEMLKEVAPRVSKSRRPAAVRRSASRADGDRVGAGRRDVGRLAAAGCRRHR